MQQLQRMDDIKALLGEQDDRTLSCHEVQALIEARLADVEKRLKDLRHVQRALKATLARCLESEGRVAGSVRWHTERKGTAPDVSSVRGSQPPLGAQATPVFAGSSVSSTPSGMEASMAEDTKTVYVCPDGTLSRISRPALPGRSPEGILVEEGCAFAACLRA